MRRLSKQQSRQRWKELRDLWNEFDPIGVVGDPNWPRDEYEAYCGPTMRLLERDATVSEIVQYLEWVVCDHMELNLDHQAAETFALRLQQWFRERWTGTHV